MSSKRYKSVSYTKKGTQNIQIILRLFPILFTVGIIPLMVRLHIYDPGLSKFSWYYAGEVQSFGDTFLVYRQWWFTGMAFYMLIVLIGKFLAEKKRFTLSVTCIPLAVYAFFALLSSVFSSYKEFSFGGMFEQFENVFVLMGYALIVYYSLIIIESEKELRIILSTLTGSSFILGLIGTMQTLGFDIYSTKFMKLLTIPAYSNADYDPTVAKGTAYMTLYNPNYVGVYIAMLLPLFIVLLIFSKKWWQIAMYSITILLLLISLYGSGSKAAFLVIGGEAVLLLIFLRRPILKLWYLVIPGATALICTFLLINQYRDNAYINRIIQALQVQKTEYSLQEMTTEEDGVHIVYRDNLLKISFDVKGDLMFMEFLDANNNPVSYDILDEEEKILLTDERFSGIEVFQCSYDGIYSFGVTIEKRTWYFTNQKDEDGTYYYWTDKGKTDRMIMAEQVIFNDYEKLFSGRGYIWSTSIPLLKKHIFLGSGADTYAIEFPQQDYLRLWRNGYSASVLSKPHCLYLQVGIQTGVISLLALLAFFGIYVVQSIGLYINTRFETVYEQVGVAVLLSVIGFAVMGISNDSSVTVSPVFWAITGLGVFVNAKYRKIRQEA